MNTINKNVRIFCCDITFKNKILEKNCMKNMEKIKFDFTSSGTPQKNDVVEGGFATLY